MNGTDDNLAKDPPGPGRLLVSLLRRMCDNVPDMIWAKDLRQNYLFANQAMCSGLLNARDTDEPLGKNDLFFALRERARHPEDPQWHTFGELCQDTDALTLQRGGPSVFEESGNIKGRFTILEVHKAPFCDENGQVIGTVGSARDITLRRRAEDQLHLAASVFTHASEGIVIIGADGIILDVNDAFVRITGFRRDEVVGLDPSSMGTPFHNQAFYAGVWRDLVRDGRWSGEFWNRRKNGEAYAEMLTISAVRAADGGVRQYVALFSDITQIKQHERQLERMANYDALTSLPNRVLLADRLHQAMAQAERRKERLAVAYLDLDGFKTINDNHGHEAGDLFLKAVAARMRQVLRQGDTLARLGGDEFVAVLHDLPDDHASVPILTHLLAAVGSPVRIDDTELHVSASIGVTFYPQQESVDADQLLRQADQAMYQAKVVGKNRYHFFDVERDRIVRIQYDTLERIQRALREHEFVLYYQPKVNMRTGEVIGVEALIRWQHAEEGLIPPSAFLPVIENHPLSVDLGEWVIDAAVTQMEKWHALGLLIQVSVNISAYHLQLADFARRLQAILLRHPDANRSFLVLEVLETSALDDVVRVSKVIETCLEMGVSFSLDDFGTGYCSLTYLKHLPVGEIKIDQSFVRGMLVDPEDLAIVGGVLSFASAFHCKIIAEGVETIGHGALLLQLGCELAQGYGIARPMPAGELPGWVALWRTDPAWLNLCRVRHEDLPALFACVELRGWVVAFERYLRGECELAPEPDSKRCCFGQWLDSVGRLLYGRLPAFHTIDSMHQRMHGLARELLRLQSRGRNTDALAGARELHDLQDALLEHVASLALTGENEGGGRTIVES